MARGNRKARPRQNLEHNGLYPYMVRFMDWSLTVAQQASYTLERRESQLRAFIVWCDERSLHDPGSITKPILERYQRHLFYYRKADGEPLGTGTQHSMLVSVKMWFKWLAQQNHIQANPASELTLPKKPRSLPRYILSPEEVAQALNQPDLGLPEGIRDRAILELLYATGMRRTEVCNLNLYAIDRKRETVFIREGKGGMDRVVPIGQRALAWVQKYLEEARPQLVTYPDSGHLFLSLYGAPFRRDVLGAIVKRHLNNAGIDKPGSCHLFRHACATHMLDNGADIRFIQALLGHTQLNTTEIYTRVSIDKLKQIHAATHPATMQITEDPRGARLKLLATLDRESEDEDVNPEADHEHRAWTH